LPFDPKEILGNNGINQVLKSELLKKKGIKINGGNGRKKVIL